ncbi:hypothetical protein PY257_11840 [Ramlibacter sp. H39-3-26]|uniref:hypothetical protein n=1 Tax=Curvibacter soli TaxID=3031331 RepID=UPI0023DBE048|nr:hypothetical protein [Ramlibacter sp. H39-3-26]MDF1485863.1 hypothetical protein [Ramlibacter sp. H39-3-26]
MHTTMAPDQTVHATLPTAGEAGAESAAALGDAYALADAIGVQLSQPLGEMEAIVQELLHTGKISRQQVLTLLASITAARRVAMQSQQLTRLSQGRLRQSHERVGLDDILRQALAERSAVFQRAGVEVSQRIRPVEVLVDPSLLASLLEALLDCMCPQACRLLVSLEVNSWPQHALLTLNALGIEDDSTLARTHPAMHGQLSWHLLSELARTMEVPMVHQTSPHQVRVQLEFPRTVAQMEDMAIGDADAGTDSVLHSELHALAAHRILLVTSDHALEQDVRAVCEQLQLSLECAESAAVALQSGDDARPDVLLVDTRTSHGGGPGHSSAAAATPAVIEIIDATGTLAMPNWDAGHRLRVSRASLRTQLPQLLALELSRAQ